MTGSPTVAFPGSSTTVGTGAGSTWNGVSANALPHVRRTVKAPGSSPRGTVNDTTGPPGWPGCTVTETDSPPTCTIGPHCSGKSDPRAVTGASTLPCPGSRPTVGTGVGSTSKRASADVSPHVRRTATPPGSWSFGTVNDTIGPPGLLSGWTVTGTDCPPTCTTGGHCREVGAAGGHRRPNLPRRGIQNDSPAQAAPGTGLPRTRRHTSRGRSLVLPAAGPAAP